MSESEMGTDQGRRRFLARAAQLGLLTASIPVLAFALPRRSAARGCPGPVLGGGPVDGGPIHKPKKTKVQVANDRRSSKTGKASDGEHHRF